jgi:PHD/YefM family antitoxin component YafN of YafNO toxin-antitoxin module
MKEYSFTEARQHFTSILDEAKKEGVVCIKRETASHFILSQ